MKRYALALLLAFVGNCLGEDANLLHQLEELTRKRDRAIATSKSDIDELYKSSLNLLLERATQSGDQAAVEKLKQVLTQLSGNASFRRITDTKSTVVGMWNFVNHTDGHTAAVALNDDFTYTADEQRIGSWEVSGDQLVVTLDRGGHVDHYKLPVRDGLLNGVNGLGHALTLTLVDPKGQEAKVGDILGSWEFANHTDGHTAVVEVNEDGTYSEAGKPLGKWSIANRQLVITYHVIDEVDRYNLPPVGGKLNGLNRIGHALTLQRKANEPRTSGQHEQ